MRRIGFGSQPRVLAATLAIWFLMSAQPAPARADSESWDAVFMGGIKVGHMRIRVVPVKDGDRQLNRILVDFVLSFKRGNDINSISMQYGTIETPEGQVLRLDTKTLASQKIIRVHGDVVDGKMVLKIENGSQKQEEVIEWTPDSYGPYGVELSLSRLPLKPGESRKVKTFVPNLNKIAEVTLNARTLEPVALGGGVTKDLLRVDQEFFLSGGKKLPEMSTTFWVDSGGQILKSFTDANGGMVTYRTTKEAAMRQVAQPFDLLAASIVKISKKINNPERTRSVIYKVSMPDTVLSEIFPNDQRQSLIPGGQPGTAGLEVKTSGLNDGEPTSETVGPEYLRPNALITSEDSRVVAHARKAVGTAKEPWAKAQAISAWVSKNLNNKNFETSFAAADEVAQTLAGDCTEHAVLTAAMCRAEDIPARVVTGLVYVNQLGGFGFHMWNEVFVNRRWVAIDSTFGQTQVDGVHLKLAESSLDGVAPFETFLTVSRVFGKLKIEVVETR